MLKLQTLTDITRSVRLNRHHPRSAEAAKQRRGWFFSYFILRSDSFKLYLQHCCTQPVSFWSMMRKKQIAALLLLVFTFPVIYQPLHVLQHRVIMDIHSGHVDSRKEHGTLSFKPGDPATAYVSSETGKKDCPVCDYKFTVNQLPAIYRLATSFIHCVEIKFCFINVYPERSEFSTISPRAPPVRA